MLKSTIIVRTYKKTLDSVTKMLVKPRKCMRLQLGYNENRMPSETSHATTILLFINNYNPHDLPRPVVSVASTRRY